MTDPRSAHRTGGVSWEALQYFNAYRFLVALLFLTLYWIGHLPQPLGVYDRALFGGTIHVYAVLAVIAAVFTLSRTPRYRLQVFAQVCVDIAVITLLMYSSGGLDSGFGMLLVIAVAGGALLTPGRIAFLFAALAAIAVLSHEVYWQLHSYFPQPNYTHAGFLGITFFFTAFVSHVLASRVQESQALAMQRGIDLQNMARLNEHIVQHLQSGIVVVDDDLRVGLSNESARSLLGSGDRATGLRIGDLSAELDGALRRWLANDGSQTVVVGAVRGGIELQASFSRLTMENRVAILIFLEDVATLRQRAQQMKLASLGRLTASIAHEVRNPLGAISHASQLLSESASLGAGEQRLTAIIDEHSRRVNSIVESILSISRHNRTEPQIIDLQNWLESFRTEFINRHDLEPEAVTLDFRGPGIRARMDPDQLRQILWNLCENGIRYSRRMPLLTVQCGVHKDTGRPYIDVADNGPGIATDSREQLFEPFFTTESGGTGLGLYIARELCEANQAALNLVSSAGDGCLFRISLSHPDKQHVLN
ncbi:MAG: hypothetical protein HYY48_07615 [Gammaproteobacteria bacterium]|nr:hypothetical protein [Gammaproteobacteria bacterium]